MSRRASNNHHHHHHESRYTKSDHNPYKVTTLSPPKPRQPNQNQRKHGGHNHHHHHHHHHHQPHQTTIDIGFSDATTTDTYYDYCEQDGAGFRHNPLRESRTTDVTFSDESGSTRLPYYEIDDEDSNAGTRNSFSERSFRHSVKYVEEQLYHEIQTPCEPTVTNGRRLASSRLSDRPQSSMSSALTNGMVYGCGGKCQTFESVCYFVLQLFFSMGILIGVSLGIAGLVLRNSAARNLQVLVYIGIMLAVVSALLLTIQCRAKNTARRRIKAIQTAKRAPLQMETLNIRTNPVLERLPSIRESHKVNVQLPQVHQPVVRPLPQRPQVRNLGEEQGIPWWRRGEDVI